MTRRAVALRRGLPQATAGVAVQTDRRFRRPDVRPGRHRGVGRIAVRTAVLAAGAVLIVAAVALVAKTLVGSRALTVDRLMLYGNVRLSRGEVEALVGGLRGENILRVDFGAYRQRIMESPWVADVRLSRILPATVEIRIVERVPMAVARVGSQLLLVDDAGVIIDQFGPQYTEFDLPIVDGLITSDATLHMPVDPDRVRLTARCLADLQAHAHLRQRVSQLDVANAHDVVALLAGDPARLHLGESDFAARLDSYLLIAPTLRERLRDIDYVDLRFDERVFVRAGGKTQAVPGRPRSRE
jgi:cell division protein FtsQ